ncbi:transposase [Streptomyces canus]|uniref:transposase n=1 Tax=Streptomyces canus TaxID=58343 RepID=UPI0038695FA4|nr:transposase [Streptomyces canus]
MDSQSVKADATVAHGSRGYDAGKKTNGRKRHLLTDTLGLLLDVLVTPASTTDRDAARILLPAAKTHFRRLSKIWADGAYRGHLQDWAGQHLGLVLDVVRRSDDVRGFQALPRRWVVERSFAWLLRSRCGPGLRATHRHKRGRHPVVDDRTHEPPPRHPTAPASWVCSDAGSVNRPGFTSTSQPRSTSLFKRALAPSTREADALSQPSTTAVRRASSPSAPAPAAAAITAW